MIDVLRHRAIAVLWMSMVFAVWCCGATRLMAQEERQQSETLFQWFKGWREYMLTSDMDSGCIAIPKQPWLVSLNFDIGGYLTGFRIPDMEIGDGTAVFRSTLCNRASVGAYYRGWGLSFGRSIIDGDASQFTFTSYGQTLGIDINYQHGTTLHCTITYRDDERTPISKETLGAEAGSASVLNINAYYVFNSRRFSYSAALGQSSMQMCDAGSFFLGLTYYASTLDVSGSHLSNYLLSDRCDISTRQIALGVGYGYNHVSPDKRFLLHGSAMPMFMMPVYNSFHMTPLVNGVAEWNDEAQAYYNARYADMNEYTSHPQPSILMVLRAAVYWNITPVLVAGVTSLLTAYPSLSLDRFSSFGLQWSAFAYLGYRL